MFKKRMLGLSAIVLLFCLAACSAKEPARQPRHQKAAAEDLIEGNTWYMRGCYDKAADYFEKALERFSACDDQNGVAKSLNNLGSLYRAKKDPDSALMFFHEAERIFTQLDAPLGRIQALSNTAAAYMDLDQTGQAEAVLDRADALARERTLVYPPLLSNRALLLIRQDKTMEAEVLLNQALLQTSEDKAFEYATIAHAMGRLLEKRGDDEPALTWYSRALDTDRKGYFIRGIAADLTALGRVHLAMGHYDKAADALYRSLKIQTLLGSANEAENISILLKTCLEAMGDTKPDTQVTDHYLKQWAGGDIVSGPCY